MRRAALLAVLGAALHFLLLPRDYQERSDLHVYLDSSLRWATGEAPYRDFPFEYPPAALLVLAVFTFLLTHGVDDDAKRLMFRERPKPRA